MHRFTYCSYYFPSFNYHLIYLLVKGKALINLQPRYFNTCFLFFCSIHRFTVRFGVFTIWPCDGCFVWIDQCSRFITPPAYAVELCVKLSLTALTINQQVIFTRQDPCHSHDLFPCVVIVLSLKNMGENDAGCVGLCRLWSGYCYRARRTPAALKHYSLLEEGRRDLVQVEKIDTEFKKLSH